MWPGSSQASCLYSSGHTSYLHLSGNSPFENFDHHYAPCTSIKNNFLCFKNRRKGYVGTFIVKASALCDHPTFSLVRERTVSDPVEGKPIDSFSVTKVLMPNIAFIVFYLVSGWPEWSSEVTEAKKQVDVLISTVGRAISWSKQDHCSSQKPGTSRWASLRNFDL